MWEEGLQAASGSDLLAERLAALEDAVDNDRIPEPVMSPTAPVAPGPSVQSSAPSAPAPAARPTVAAPANTNVTAGRTILPRPVHRVAAPVAAPPAVRVKQEPGEPAFVIPDHARNSRASPEDVDAYVPGTVEVESESSAGEADDGEYAATRSRTAGKSAAKVRTLILATCEMITPSHRPP